MTKYWVCVVLLLILAAGRLNSQSKRKSTLEIIEQIIFDQNFEVSEKLLDSLILATNPEEETELFILANARLIDLYNRMGLYEKGVKLGEKFYSQHSLFLDKTRFSLVEFYLHWGRSYSQTQSNNQKALAYLKQSHNLYLELGLMDKSLEAVIFRYLGGMQYYEGDYEESIQSIERAIELLDIENEKTQVAVCLRSIGNSYWGLQEYDKASNFYERSIDVLMSDKPVDSLSIGKVLHAKGYIHMNQEDYELAYKTFDKAAEILSETHPKVSSPVVWVFGDMGHALFKLEQYDSSLFWLQKALIANVFEYKEDNVYHNPPLENVNDDFQHFMILKLKGQVFQKKYISSMHEKDLNAMIDCFQLADKQIDEMRKSISRNEDHSTISFYADELNSQAIKVLLELYLIDPEPRFLSLAYYFLERQKITLVYLKFLEETARSQGLLPLEALEKDHELLSNVSDAKSRLKRIQTDSGDSLELARTHLFQEQLKYENFVLSIKKNYPIYHSARFDLTVSSVNDIQMFLKENQPDRAIITYHEFDGIFISSVITQDTISVNMSEREFDLFELSNGFREYLRDPGKDHVENSDLNKLLTRGVFDTGLMKAIDKITFISDPAIQHIPMELLQVEGQFLFEKYDIGYHFSSTTLLNQNDARKNSNFVGFAPSFDSLEFANLQGAIDEVQSIQEVYGGQCFFGNDALEQRFRNANSGIIHLATHAQIDQEDPELSFLQFGEGVTAGDDGKLHFFEIYDLNLNAQLVTLSACNTGFGKIRKGEGVMSLSRAFAYAGVPATVVSLWPASDKSTPELMKHFYQNLKDGQAKDEALNNARKQYLATAKGKARHPFYWGGFVLIGDNSPIEENETRLFWAIPFVLMIVILLGIYRIRKPKKLPLV